MGSSGAAAALTLGCVWEDLTLHSLSDLDWNGSVNNLNTGILAGMSREEQIKPGSGLGIPQPSAELFSRDLSLLSPS